MGATVISMTSQKGGVGKSTLAMTLGRGLSLEGYRVKLLDGDGQKTASQMKEIGFDADVILINEFTANEIIQFVANVYDDYDFIIIDCPPAVDSPIVEGALRVANLAMVITQPGLFDLLATRATFELIAEAKQRNPVLCTSLVINRTNRTNAASATVAQLQLEYPMTTHVLSDLTVYREAFQLSPPRTCFEIAGKARVEFQALLHSLLNGELLPLVSDDEVSLDNTEAAAQHVH